MIELVDPNDSRAVRNKNNVLALYDQMINRKNSEEATARFVSPAHIQHNPLLQTVQSRWESTSVRSRANAPKLGSLSTASSLSATTFGPT